MRIAVTLAVFSLFATAAFAADPQQTGAVRKDTEVSGVTVTGAPPAPKAEDPLVCRSSNTSGSRVRATKVCKKRSEWATAAKARGRGNQDIRMDGCDAGGSNCGLSDRPPGN
jgi:hypothetical protein